MKTFISLLIKICWITVLTIGFTACRSKHLINQKFRTSSDQIKDINIKTTKDDFYRGSSVISIRDSTKHQYQVNIFPLDSFSFSLQDGFRGRAHIIELIGEIHQRKETSKLHDSIAAQKQKSEYYEKVKTSENGYGKTKNLKKQSFNIISIGVLIGVIVLAGYVYKRYFST